MFNFYCLLDYILLLHLACGCLRDGGYPSISRIPLSRHDGKSRPQAIARNDFFWRSIDKRLVDLLAWNERMLHGFVRTLSFATSDHAHGASPSPDGHT
ncbi:hypothetical protein BU26DRAFT_257410 [Trematosphaeria pertusa]|uniref:Secreted protein n=1 Tax=Trematosphaeria pertusa TaxID=390896 RepID=A0A6A6IRN3_9PLEO|nr:uncharacterized protein BU26DRAFT_257410 [Trematosphaeria pertusa]KAF2252462.1 hypothetical protein BU26DRAFT_257410 [Trematosphaeria pertusa]